MRHSRRSQLPQFAVEQIKPQRLWRSWNLFGALPREWILLLLSKTEIVELLGERLDLLHLVVDHLDELHDFLRGIDDRLNGVSRILNDPLRACRLGDAERYERECD